MKKYKNVLLSLIPYICIPIVFIAESQYFTMERVGALSHSGYNIYLTSVGLPIIVLALLGIFFAFRGKHAKEPSWATITSMSVGVLVALFVLLAMGFGSTFNGL